MTDLIQQLHHYANGECDMTPVGSTLLEAAEYIEQLEAKLIIAVAYIRRHIPDSIYEQRQQARSVLAELEGKEEAAGTAWRGRE